MQTTNRMSALAIAVALSHFIEVNQSISFEGVDLMSETVIALRAISSASENVDIVEVHTLAAMAHREFAYVASAQELFVIVAIQLATGSESDINMLTNNMVKHVEL